MPTGARNLADADEPADAPHALDVASDLRVPERQLEPEGHRLGVHAVRAADHRRVLVLLGARTHGLGEPLEVGEDHVAGVAHLQRLRRVDDVRRGEPEVEPAGRGPHLLGDGGREGDDVVLGGRLDLFDARDVEPAARADVRGGLGRDEARSGHRLGGRRLDREPRLVAPLVGPDAAHLGVGVAGDHR